MKLIRYICSLIIIDENSDTTSVVHIPIIKSPMNIYLQIFQDINPNENDQTMRFRKKIEKDEKWVVKDNHDNTKREKKLCFDINSTHQIYHGSPSSMFGNSFLMCLTFIDSDISFDHVSIFRWWRGA